MVAGTYRPPRRSCHYHRDDGYLREPLPRRGRPRPRGHRRDFRGGSDGTGSEPGNVVTVPCQVSDTKGGAPACRPGSVLPLARGGGHPSRTAVAGSLVRSTREHRAGRPQSLAQGAVAPLLTLLRVGFTEPPQSPAALVVSYTTVSPLPPRWRAGAVCFLWHCPAGHPGSALPTTLPCGARTFLTELTPGATARPTHPCSGYAERHRAGAADRGGARTRHRRGADPALARAHHQVRHHLAV